MPADDQLFFRLTQQIKVPMNKFDLCVVGLGSRIGKEDVLESFRRHLTKPRRQLRRWLVRAPKEVVVEREFGQLLRHSLFDSILTVAQIAAPQA